MQKRVSVAIVFLIVLFLVGVVLMVLARSRGANAREACRNNLRLICQSLGYTKQANSQPIDVKLELPAGTLPNPSLPPDQRLSWIASIQPELSKRLDRASAWDAGSNAELSRTSLRTFICPANPAIPPNTEPAFTHYVGAAGIAPHGPMASLGPPVPTDVGCFRYDSPTPLRVIIDNDGLSNTILLGEVSDSLGPWIRGGSSTLRPFDPASDKPPIGIQGQFGGNHSGVSAFAFADGSGRFLTDRINPGILRGLFTIAGRESDSLPNE